MKRVEVPLNLGYISSSTKQYWCHLCQKEFSRLYIENSEVHCRSCGKTFCEEVASSNQSEHPSNYQPFEHPRRNNDQNNRVLFGFSPISNILSSIMNFNNFNEDSHMENIINFLMANDPNKYGSPPASKEEVSKLQKIKVSKSNQKEVLQLAGESCCSVCKDDFLVDQQLVKLPCNHVFHDECILPWLNERNSCPTCRFELKTDDSDYESRKKEKRDQVRQTANNNLGINNNNN